MFDVLHYVTFTISECVHPPPETQQLRPYIGCTLFTKNPYISSCETDMHTQTHTTRSAFKTTIIPK